MGAGTLPCETPELWAVVLLCLDIELGGGHSVLFVAVLVVPGCTTNAWGGVRD